MNEKFKIKKARLVVDWIQLAITCEHLGEYRLLIYKDCANVGN